MQKRVNQQIKYYFSERLKRQLEQISHHPLTIVEAPYDIHHSAIGVKAAVFHSQ